MPQDLVEVYVAIGQAEGSIVKSYLEAHGVPIMSVQEGAGAAYGINVGLLGEVHLFVAKIWETKARELIDQMEQPADISEDEIGPAEDSP
jgi:hypothetical protein